MDAAFKSSKTLQLLQTFVILHTEGWSIQFCGQSVLLTDLKMSVIMCNAYQHDDVLSSSCTKYTELTHLPPIQPFLTMARHRIWTGAISINSSGLAAWLVLAASPQGWFSSRIPPDLVQIWEHTLQWNNASLPARVGWTHIFQIIAKQTQSSGNS